MKHLTHITTLLSAGLTLSALGCAAGPSSQLMNARAAYQQAKEGPANQVEPEHVIEAKNALERAERAHDDDPSSAKEQHYAYIANLKAQQAMAKASYTIAVKDKEASEKTYLALSETELAKRGDRLSDQQKDLRDKDQELAAQGSELEEERSRRIAAETALKDALKSLKELAKVKAEDKKIIITLNGSVLFEFAKSNLLPAAKDRLMAVVTYLKSVDSNKKITIGGHTDSVGTDSENEALSKSRAEAVKRFLVDNGVDASRITTIGYGEKHPIADNKSDTGRANNRRVEIEIEN